MIYVLSLCERSNRKGSYFHFRGYYKGGKINKIFVCEKRFNIDKAYLLAIELIEVKSDTIVAKLIKYKELSLL